MLYAANIHFRCTSGTFTVHTVCEKSKKCNFDNADRANNLLARKRFRCVPHGHHDWTDAVLQ